MADAMELFIGFLLSIGVTLIAFKAKERFLPYIFAAILWLALGILVLEMNFMLSLCCVAMMFYLMLRSVYA